MTVLIFGRPRPASAGADATIANPKAPQTASQCLIMDSPFVCRFPPLPRARIHHRIVRMRIEAPNDAGTETKIRHSFRVSAWRPVSFDYGVTSKMTPQPASDAQPGSPPAYVVP